jgi:hypothetical protein
MSFFKAVSAQRARAAQPPRRSVRSRAGHGAAGSCQDLVVERLGEEVLWVPVVLLPGGAPRAASARAHTHTGAAAGSGGSAARASREGRGRSGREHRGGGDGRHGVHPGFRDVLHRRGADAVLPHKQLLVVALRPVRTASAPRPRCLQRGGAGAAYGRRGGARR